MKITYAKLRITIGKTQVALVVKMNIFGQWLLTNCMAIAIVQTQALLALARNHLQKQALQKLALQKLVPAEKLLRNNLLLFLQKNTCRTAGIFCFKCRYFFQSFYS